MSAAATATVVRARDEKTLGHEAAARMSDELRRACGAKYGELAVLRTGTGRVITVEVASSGERRGDEVQLSRLLRQALKLRIGERVSLERSETMPVARVVLTPFADLSTASGHDLELHVKASLRERGIPVSLGLIIHATYPGSVAGTLYRATQVEGGPGRVTEETEIRIEFTIESLQANLAQDLTFEDFGGLHEQLRVVRELVELPLRFPGLFRDLGIMPPKGVLLFGPPGTGKTHLSRALANEIAASFFHINGPEIVGTSYGETEGNLRRIFAEATHHAPSLVFIDEVDAIAPKRTQVGTQTDTRMVTQLLASMDGLRRSDGVIVVGTTNRVDAVDPALRRPGRFDREIFFAPPDAAGRQEILEIHSREMPLTGEAVDHLRVIAERSPGYVGADLMEVCREAGLSALRRSVPRGAAHHELRHKAVTTQVEPRDFDEALTHVRPSASRQAAASTGGVRWSDVGGLESVKDRLRTLVQLPLVDPKRFSALDFDPPSGILLYGPPGTGKTLLVRALATETNANFVPLNGPEIFSQWVGESEEAVRQVFILARQLAPAIVFIDQLDAIAPNRRGAEDSGTAARVVNQLLAELDGVRPLGGVVVIAATNRVDLIDSSVLRPGRLGTHVRVDLPDASDRRAVLEVLLRRAPFASGAARRTIISAMAKATEGSSGAELRQLVDEAKLVALRQKAQRPVLRKAAFDEALEVLRGDRAPSAERGAVRTA